jgi:hypothetical protein
MLVICLLLSCQSNDQVDFNTQIKPIINKKCISCHGGVKKTAGFSFLFKEEALGNTDEGSPAIIPGNAKKSRLIQRLHETDLELRMPFEKPALSEEEIVLFTKWIDQGAEWGTHWAYIPPIKSKLPKASKKFQDIEFIKTPIDNFVAEKLDQKKLLPNKPASKNILARRVALDITGLPPSQDLFNSYLNSEISYENFVDSLLSSKSYGEKWASWWLDLARYADTRGYEADRGRMIWKYRDWVINSLNDDMPFDEFTINQLAGDLLENPTIDNYIATGFHRNTMTNDEGGTSNEEYRVASVIDRVNTTFDVWQGTTISCVQCHAHPYDPIRHKEYYQVMSFFNNTKDFDHTTEEPNYRFYNDNDQQKILEIFNWIDKYGDQNLKHKFQEFIYFLEPKVLTNEINSEVISNSGNVNSMQELYFRNNGSALIKNVNTEKNNRMVALFNYGIKGTKVIIRNGSSTGEIIAEFKNSFETGWMSDPDPTDLIPAKPGFVIDFPVKSIDGTIDLHIEAKNDNLSEADIDFNNGKIIQFHWFGFMPDLPGKNKKGYSKIKKYVSELLFTHVNTTPIMLENKKHNSRSTYMFERGSWLNPKEKVTSNVPESFSDWNPNWEPNRLGLAQWLTDKENSLTSRTLVNRIWHQIFGTGIVSTIEDMGTQSEPPTHPKLLDWMSVNLIEDQKWSLKKLIKSIVLSSTYKQSSKISEEKYGLDPNNIFYSRGPKIRLKAEEVRDQALAVSGLISRKMGGVGVMPPQPEGVWQSPYNGEEWIESIGEDRYRRAVYTYIKRTATYPSFVTFDAGSREVCLINRITTNTPLQALVTLNDLVYLEAAYHLASKYQNDESAENSIKKMYLKSTYKEISQVTLDALLELYSNSINQFKKSPELIDDFLELGKTKINHAALTLVANAIMNLDEFLTHS